MAFLVTTTSMPAVCRPNDDARMTTAGTPHARANILIPSLKSVKSLIEKIGVSVELFEVFYWITWSLQFKFTYRLQLQSKI